MEDIRANDIVECIKETHYDPRNYGYVGERFEVDKAEEVDDQYLHFKNTRVSAAFKYRFKRINKFRVGEEVYCNCSLMGYTSKATILSIILTKNCELYYRISMHDSPNRKYTYPESVLTKIETTMNMKEQLKQWVKDYGHVIVVTRSHNNYIALLKHDQLLFVNHDGWTDLSGMSDDLICRRWSIDKIYRIESYKNYLNPNSTDQLLWQRPAHTITINGKEIKLSEESYNELKKQLI